MVRWTQTGKVRKWLRSGSQRRLELELGEVNPALTSARPCVQFQPSVKKSCNIRLTVMNGSTRHTELSVYNTQNFGTSALIQKYL